MARLCPLELAARAERSFTFQIYLAVAVCFRLLCESELPSEFDVLTLHGRAPHTALSHMVHSLA